jgi:hypothetical protein
VRGNFFVLRRTFSNRPAILLTSHVNDVCSKLNMASGEDLADRFLNAGQRCGVIDMLFYNSWLLVF